MRATFGFRCRILPFEVADGPENMARDETLLEEAAEAGPSAGAIFRTYGWSEPTLSLGYFQHLAEAASDPRWDSVPIVRRPTGGGALWHDRELTYALILPSAHPIARQPKPLYRSVHSAIAQAIEVAGMGLDLARRGDDSAAWAEPLSAGRPFLCFRDRDPEDLVDRGSGSKVVGSAQRRRVGATLIHGALLLGRSPRTPELPGLADLAGASAEPALWAAPIGDRVVAALGLEAVAGLFTDQERRRADGLARRVYSDPAWTAKR